MHACSKLDIPSCFFISDPVADDGELGEQSNSAGLGYQLAFLWQNAVNTLFGNSSHQNINTDPSSVGVYIQLMELSLAGFWQSAVKIGVNRTK